MHLNPDESLHTHWYMQKNLSKLSEFALAYRDLFRDKRLFAGFVGTLQGILGSQGPLASIKKVFWTSR